MLTKVTSRSAVAVVVAFAVAACSKAPDSTPPVAAPVGEAATTAAVTIPESLAPFGDGFPAAGDPCRRLGESPATVNYLDDSAMLIGCPSAEAAAALPGTVVATIEGTTLVSISTGDALVPGTDYHATTEVPCGFDGTEPTGNCFAGVKRNWGEPGSALVEVTKPDGLKRAIFFRGTTAYGADSAEADGSAGWTFEVSRRDDQSVIKYGPETYVIFDALVVGG